MSINNGSLVTLLVRKEHVNGDFLSEGISGIVLQRSFDRDNSSIYIVDFGSEGQWNCTESELSTEGLVSRVRELSDTPNPPIRRSQELEEEDDEEDDEEVNWPNAEIEIDYGLASTPSIPMRPKKEKKEINPDDVLSFEEELALMEQENG